MKHWSWRWVVISSRTYRLCGGFGLVLSRFSVRMVCAWTSHFHWRDQNLALVICKIVTLYLNSLKMPIYVNFRPIFTDSSEQLNFKTNSYQFYAKFKTIPILDKHRQLFRTVFWREISWNHRQDSWCNFSHTKTIKHSEELRGGYETEETCLGWALSLGRSEHELAKQLIAALKSLAAYIKIGASGPSNNMQNKKK